LICVVFAAPLVAQSNSHGLRLNGLQTAELTTIDEVPDGPSNLGRPLSLQFETWVEQLPKEHAEGVYSTFGGIDERSGKASIRRVIQDHFRNLQIGYLVTVEAEPNTQGYRVSFEDLPANGADAPKGFSLLSPEAHPVPQFVLTGDVLKVNLFTRPEQTKLVEYVRIGGPKMKEFRDDAPRDAYAEDAEFSIAQPRFRANGRSGTTSPVADLHGPMLRVGFPGFGTYVLSLKPHADLGFENAGEISGSSLTFMVRGNVFRIDCAERIASGSAAYNVYAMLDTAKESLPAEGSGVTISAEPAVPSPK
jgi:hypothetical protein